MTLYEFLSKLDVENKVKAIIYLSGKELCTIYSNGIEALSLEYKECTVDSWWIEEKQTIKIRVEPHILSA